MDRDRPPALRPFEHGRRVVAAMALAIEEAVELADRREPPRERGRRQPAPFETGQMGAQGRRVGANAIERPAPVEILRRSRRDRAGRRRACWRRRRARPRACRGTARSAFRCMCAAGEPSVRGPFSEGGLKACRAESSRSSRAVAARRYRVSEECAGIDQGPQAPQSPAGIGTRSAFSHSETAESTAFTSSGHGLCHRRIWIQV